VVVVGALASSMGWYQAALGQATRQPSVDQRNRNVDQSSVDDPLQNRRRTNTRPVSENEKRTEKPAAPYLGVIFGTDNRGGATVRKISPKSPAEQAGLQVGDVIESLQGKRVRSSQDVQNILRKLKPGEVIDIEYSRRMSLRTQAALGSEPGASQRTVGYPPDEASDDSKELKSGRGQTNRDSDENQQRRGRGFRRR
jgi:S1-C subfamily serine protease